jgi:GNAT superfamily N-acetyltransferase
MTVPAGQGGKTEMLMGSGAWIDPADPTLELATARDGTAVQLRLLRRDDRELVAGFFTGLSAESRRRRFLQPMPRLPEAMLRRLVEVDGRRHVAVVAEVDGHCVGIARWIALADQAGAAEVAVTVTDRYQGRGIGRLLVAFLRPLAVRADLTSLVYLVDSTNRPALGLLRSLGVELAFRDGLVEGCERLGGRPLLDASSGPGPAPAEWPGRAGPSTRQLPDPHPHRSPGPFVYVGRLMFAANVVKGRSQSGGRHARRHRDRPGDQTIRHGAGGTAAHGLVALRLLRGLDHPPGPALRIPSSVLLRLVGGDVGRIVRHPKEVAWETGTST